MNDGAASNDAIGNLGNLHSGQVLLPSFVIKRPDGIYIDISALDSPGLLPRFVEHVFASEACFEGLEYATFLKLLFEYTPADIDRLLQKAEMEGQHLDIRLARGIVNFPRERQAYYRGLKVAADGSSAEYLFEQVSHEVELEEMSYGEPDESGNRPETGLVSKTVTERVFLNFDEFIAAAWLKGLRYGIDEQRVRAAIAADRNERLPVAQHKLPTAGHDASVEERSSSLRRDDTPRLLPNGRVDLAHFSNRFPQVTAGTLLFRKLPRVAGVSGWTVEGKEIAPEPVKDFDLESMAGPGTRVERQENGDLCLVASMDGFLNIDSSTGEVSVSEKIINRSGVSVRTTGNLSLGGDEYEEHGQVQEKRRVVGRNMTFFAEVYGDIESDGGCITLKQTIAGGSATANGGSIMVEGKASSATLQARRGSIEAASAEGAILVGEKVRVTQAVRCDIVADEVSIEQAEGCFIAARRVHLKQASARKSQATQIILLLPDDNQLDKEVAAALAEQEAAQAELATRNQMLAELAEQAEVKTYLSVQPKLKSGKLVMSPAQEASWKALTGRVAPKLRELATHQANVKSLTETIGDAAERAERLRQEKAEANAAVGCTIEQVRGETIVLGRRVRRAPFDNVAPKDLHARLQEVLPTDERLFADDAGELNWRVTPAGDS